MASMNPAQIEKFLGGMNYPASRDDLVDYAKQRGADTNVLQTLQRLPYDSFDTPGDVSEAVGEIG